MDRFLALSTITERSLANHICGILEEAQIAVLLEHVELVEGNVRSHGYRLLVPAQYAQTAKRLVDSASTSFMNRDTSDGSTARILM